MYVLYVCVMGVHASFTCMNMLLPLHRFCVAAHARASGYGGGWFCNAFLKISVGLAAAAAATITTTVGDNQQAQCKEKGTKKNCICK